MDNQTGIKTLIVEDSIPTRRMLRARLETLGMYYRRVRPKIPRKG